jgi:hypothetical protein
LSRDSVFGGFLTLYTPVKPMMNSRASVQLIK